MRLNGVFAAFALLVSGAPVPAGVSSPSETMCVTTISAQGTTDERDNADGSKEVTALIQRPKLPVELLKNLQSAWDQRLLRQRSFWSNEQLLAFFNAEKVTWDPEIVVDPHWSPDRGLIDQDGRLILLSKLLTLPVRVGRATYEATEESAAWLYHYPKHTERTGWLLVELGENSGITWGDVRGLFGPGAINTGPPPPPISKSAPGSPRSSPGYQLASWESQYSAKLCYQSPTAPRDKMADWEMDRVCFHLKFPSKADRPRSQWPLWDPRDGDPVLFVSLTEHSGHILMLCYALKLDPAFLPLCPPRASQGASK